MLVRVAFKSVIAFCISVGISCLLVLESRLMESFVSITAGPRFVSVGFIMIFLFRFRSLKACACIGQRLERFFLLHLVVRQLCLFLSAFSNSVVLFSIAIGAGGGCQLEFFT